MIKFTIITICYNEEERIGKTVESVLQQTNREYEYIIVDGASTDQTLNILSSYKNAVMRIYSEPDSGISDAFNKGIAYSNGEYLLFLNSGDYFLENDVLERVANDIKNCSEEVITFAIKSIISNFLPDSEREGIKLWNESLIPHQGSFIKKEVFTKVGGFNPYYKIRMDYDFFTRCRIQNITFKCIPKQIVYYDSSGVSSTDNYNAQREGLAVRLLYEEAISKQELDVIQYLVGGDGVEVSKVREELEIQRSLAIKHFKIMMLMNRWIHMLQCGKVSSNYFTKKAVCCIAIYGWGYLGKCLADELQGTDIKVEYVIDQNKKISSEDVTVYNWVDAWPEVDMIVVTPVNEYQNIRKKIKSKMKCRVVSIEEVITER